MAHYNDKGRIGQPTIIDRLYRRIRPIPPSPAPQTPSDVHRLRLVPAEALTQRFEDILRTLRSEAAAPMGDYVEFGVYNGTSMTCMFTALSRLGLNQVALFGFDSFMGLPPEASHEDGGVWKPGQFACPKEVAVQNLISGGVPPERVHLVEGWYKDTLEKAPADYGIKNVSCVLIDSDTYSAARLALEFIFPVLDSVAALIFDDWKLNDLDIKGMGEYRAFNEFLDQHPRTSVESLHGYNRKSKVFILRRSASISDR